MSLTLRSAVLLILIEGLVTGCVPQHSTVLSTDEPTIRDIYEDQFGGTKTRSAPDLGDSIISECMPSGASEYRRVRNPTLNMYVYPHLATKDRVPVPGYTVPFPMYETVEYALPGEFREQRDAIPCGDMPDS